MSGSTATTLPAAAAATASGTPDLRLILREEVGSRLEELHRFIDRRIAEISVEVHGAVQMVDFSEANLSGQLGRIHAQIASVVAPPAQASRGSGLELEAVVQATEAAADRILEAAEAISAWVAGGRRDPDGYKLLNDKVNAIFEACSFQDLTGQRIRRAIEHLRHVEGLLEEIMHTGPVTEAPSPAGENCLGQPDIDRLLG